MVLKSEREERTLQSHSKNTDFHTTLSTKQNKKLCNEIIHVCLKHK